MRFHVPTYTWGLVFAILACGAIGSNRTRVAVITSCDCPSTQYATHREYGTQFAASLTVLLRMKELHPEWDALIVSDKNKWRSSSCRRAYHDFHMLYSEMFGGQQLGHLNLIADDFPVLKMLSKTGGGELDHSRGHWPVEAYFHLVTPALMLKRGYSHTVYVDADVWPMDSSLASEILHVEAIGCVSAIPPQCLLSKATKRMSSMRRALRDEYRLVSDPENLAKVSALAPRGYHLKNGTNSGVVIYNNAALVALGWAAWLHGLLGVSARGFYSDQTALSVAMGRDDVAVHWLPARFNVALTLPRSYVAATCGADAVYSRHAAGGSKAKRVSFVHFTWGPKPWMQQLNARHAMPTSAVQADRRYANMYRAWVLGVLGRNRTARYFHPRAFDEVTEAMSPTVLDGKLYKACRRSPFPCGLS
jgi:hypothetical protein